MKLNLPPEFEDSSSDEGATFSTLRADAPPFYAQNYEPINIAIYNDGVPSMTVPSEQGLSDILHGIEDPLDQFPPDAEDAWELEMADCFVKEMAQLAILEESDYRARTRFTHIKKRWEVRRAAGPSGRPKLAMHYVEPVKHVQNKAINVQTLVVSSRHHRMHLQDKMRMGELKERMEPRSMKMTAMKHTQPIQQPRKHY